MDEEKLSAEEERRLLEIFEQSSLNEYPNPNRVGCPGLAFLRKLAFDRRSIPIRRPDLTHVTRCSPCFREFLEFRKQAARRKMLNRAAAIIGMVVLAIGLGLYFTRGWGSLLRTPRSGGTYVIANLDMKNFVVLRGAAESDSPPAEEPLRLRRGRLALTITLPLASQVGPYEIEVLPEKGKPLASATGEARIEKGLTVVSVNLDLSALSPGVYLVGIRRTNRDWAYAHVRLIQ